MQDLGELSRSPSFAGSDAASVFSQDKKKFGALLPRSGVYFLPDERIMAFQKLVNLMRRRYEGDQNYMTANSLKDVFSTWGQEERHRQAHNMRVAQHRELITIEEAQKVQYFEFAKNWDKFMADYEQAAHMHIMNLKEKQSQELIELIQFQT